MTMAQERNRPLRVMIVEDSAVVRTLICHIVESDPRLSVIAAVGTAEEAIARIEEVRPDIISMDIRLPGIDGLEATRRIMAAHPTPIVVIAGVLEKDAPENSMAALRAGALAVVDKPVGVTSRDYAAVAADICTQLVIMSEVPVVRRRIRAAVAPPRQLPLTPGRTPRIAVCAASTGGPQALAKLFAALPDHWELPILLVQHMGESFMEGFAHWLDGVIPLDVAVAIDGESPAKRRVHVAPGDRHMRIGSDERIAIGSDIAIRGQRPAATALFQSAAETFGADALGIVLTGMGEDGGPGVERMIAAGATVIAEHASSAVVNGMPAAAVRAGALALPLDLMPIQLGRIVSPSPAR